MRDNDRQLGKPMRVYRDTKANIEALTLGAADEGCIAYATDIKKFGRFGHSAGRLGWGWYMPYNIQAFGAVGDNVVDDTAAIQATIDAAANNAEAGVVYVPPLGSGINDRYKTTSALDWKGGVCFLGSGYYSRISAHVGNGAFPVIQDHATTEQGNWMKGLCLGFEDYYDDVLAKVLAIMVGAPALYTIEDCTLRNGYYGYYDNTAGYMAHLRRVYAYKNRVGFHKSGGGTGHHFDTCYAGGKSDDTWDMRGFDISNGVSYVLEACSMDDYHSPINAIARFAGNYTLTINGFVMERDQAVTNGNCIMEFDENHSVFVSGMKDTDCVINAAAANNTRLIAIYKERIHFSGCELGAGTTVDAAGGGAAGYTIDIAGVLGGLSRITLTAGAIVNPISGVNAPAVSAVRLATAVNTCELTLDRVLKGTILNPNVNRVLDTGEISVGAPNSGGAGFKLLRVPNVSDTT